MAEKTAEAKPEKKKPDKPMAPCQSDPAASFQRVAVLRKEIAKATREETIANEIKKEKTAAKKKLEGQLYELIDDEQSPNLFGNKRAGDGIKVNAGKKGEPKKDAAIDPNALGDEWRTVLLSAVLAEKDAVKFAEKNVRTLGEYTTCTSEFLKGLEAKDQIGETACKRAAKAVGLYFVELNKERLKAQAKKSEPAA